MAISTIDNSGLSATAAIATSKLGAGAVLQVVSATKTDSFSTTSTTYVDVTGMSVSITPKSSTSKILIIANGFLASVANAGYLATALVRDSTVLTYVSDTSYGQYFAAYWNPNSPDTDRGYTTSSYFYLDSPATTSSVTYKIQARTYNGTVGAFNARYAGGSILTSQGAVSTITVMEIAA